MKKKVWMPVLMLALCLGLLTVPALAAEAVDYVEYSWDGTSLSSATNSVTEYTEITESITTWGVEDTTSWYVVKGNVTIDSRVTVKGDVHLILTDGCSLTTNGITVKSHNSNGVNYNYSLTIYGQRQGTGTLSAIATDNFAAGIGGGYPGDHCGTVVIHGGVVTAEGKSDYSGAGIGGAGAGGSTGRDGGNGDTVTVYSGTVTAVGGYHSSTKGSGAGIGGGGGSAFKSDSGNGGTVKIYGGVVNATGGRSYCGAGIGGGGCVQDSDNGGKGGNVTIAGGIVTATGYDDDIGAGYSNQSDDGTYQASACIVNGTVCGSFTLTEDYTIPAGKTLTVPEGATLTIPDGVTLTVNGTLINNGTIANNGTLRLQTKNKLSGSGTVTGSGANLIQNITAERIIVPANLVYTGTDQTTDARYAISLLTSYETICNASFEYSTWSFDSISPAVVKDAGTYTVTFKHFDCDDVTKTFTVAPKDITGAAVSVFDSLTYNGQSQVPKAIVTVDGLTVTGSWSPVRNVTDETIFTADGNFMGSTAPCSPGMQPKSVTAVVTAQDKYWDDHDYAEITITADTGISGETLTIPGIAAIFQDTEVGEGKTVVLRKEFMEIQCSNGRPENYTVTVPDTATASIKVVPLTLTGITMDAESYTYGDAVGYDNAELSIAQPGGTAANAEDLVYTYTGTAVDGTTWNSTTAPTKAGSYTLTVSHRDTAHYSCSQSVNFTINKAPATVTAKDQRYHIGTKLPETFEPGKHYTIDGLLGEDSIGSVTLKFQKDGEDVTPDTNKTGSYDIIVVVTDVNPNYEVSLVSGKLSYYYIPTYTPTVANTEGGNVTVSSNYPTQGQTVTITAKPDEGMMVDTVTVTDKDGNEIEVTENSNGTYSFRQPAGSVTIKVTFKLETCPSEEFADLDPDAWYHDAVDYVLHKGLMNGVGGGKFDPNGTASRAMIVTLLWRLEGEPICGQGKSGTFVDVPEYEWYTEAVEWAAANGIVEGWNGNFDPMGLITREQLAAILYRYEQYTGGGFKGLWMFLLDYTDRDQVSDWAYEAMCWTTMHDVINGKGGGILDPKGSAKRCEVAQMLMNYLNV